MQQKTPEWIISQMSIQQNHFHHLMASRIYYKSLSFYKKMNAVNLQDFRIPVQWNAFRFQPMNSWKYRDRKNPFYQLAILTVQKYYVFTPGGIYTLGGV